MFKRILVPLDGSARAERAIPVAAHLAGQHDGTVILIRVIGASAAHDGRVVADVPLAPWMRDIDGQVRTAAAYLAHAVLHGALAGVRTEIGICSGSPAEAILAAARARRADVIVLCGQDHYGIRQWSPDEVPDLSDSDSDNDSDRIDHTEEQVIRDAAVPVLVVPEEGSLNAYAGVARLRPLRALVALDGSALAETALVPAVQVTAALADPGLGALHLMHIARDEASREDARSYLSAVAHELRSGALTEQLLLLTWSVERGQDAAVTLLAQANRPRNAMGVDTSIQALYGTAFDGEIAAGAFDGADLIVIAARGYAGLYQQAIGPVAQRVLRLATCPVLVVRPGLPATEMYRQRDVLTAPVAETPR